MKLVFGVAALALAGAAIDDAHAEPLTRAEIRAAVDELAGAMARGYVFPDIAEQYAAHLRAQANAGAFDADTDPEALAAALTRDMNGVHPDAHLHVIVTEPQADEPAPMRGPPPASTAFNDERWLSDGVAYVRIAGFPANAAAAQRMTEILDRFESARTLILDARRCPGGGLEAMDVLFSRLYAQPTPLLNMDTRSGADEELNGDPDESSPTLRPEPAPPGLTRLVHWAAPTDPVSPLANARVFVLTDRTASACEHMALALQASGRATLVGATTRGAGHYGGEASFGGGRFAVWLPIGRTYVAATNRDWEGVGVTPDQAVAPDDALNVVLAQLGVARSAASDEVSAPRGAPRIAASGQPRYGIALAPPRGGEQALEVLDVAADGPAAQAGLRAGDRILSLNGTPVSQIAPQDFGGYMRAPQLTVQVERDGQPLIFAMALPAAATPSAQ